MSRFKNAIIYLLSFLITIVFMIFISNVIGYFTLSQVNDTNIILHKNIIFTITLFFFALILAVIRRLSLKKFVSHNIFLSTTINEYSTNDKLWFYIVLILIYFLRIIRDKSFSSFNLSTIILFSLSIILAKVLIIYSQKTMKLYLTKDYIVITGFDIRIKPPFIFAGDINNDSGFYNFSDIKEILIHNTHVEIILIYEVGKLIFDTDYDTTRKLEAVLIQNKVKYTKI